MLNLEQGRVLVRLARKTVERWFREKKFVLEKVDDEVLKEKRGVFVTIESFPSKSLRGCIGLLGETLPVYEALQRSAFSSAFEDPRFPPLKEEELKRVTFEISIMTKPELIEIKDPKEYFEKIEIGKDGLILVSSSYSGILLPQVPLEWGWDVKTYLEHLCMKAGLPEVMWQDRTTQIFKFNAQIFREVKPGGNVIEVRLSKIK